MGDKTAPRFLSKPSIKQDGKDIVFATEIEAAPKPDIAWFKGDTPLAKDPRMVPSVDQAPGSNKYTLSLRLKAVTPDDTATYRVEAKNALGQMSANINLNLQQGRYLLMCWG